MKKKDYVSPSVKMVEVEVEKGFADSGDLPETLMYDEFGFDDIVDDEGW